MLGKPIGKADMTEETLDWHALDPDDAIDRLESGREGFSAEEAARRLEEHGPNRLEAGESRRPLLRFLLQFHNILIYILIAAAVVTALIGEWIDTGVILAVVFINAAIGFIQEGKAERALEAIGRRLSTEARVLRDGNRETIPAEEVVPGDVVIAKAGDKIPADLRLFEARELRIDEALLTGESAPVQKAIDPADADAGLGDRSSMAFSGTLVTSGYGRGVVVATAGRTQIGRISELVQETQELTTPLIRQITAFGRTLAMAIVGLAVLTFSYGVFVQDMSPIEVFTAAVAIAVAAIPEGLPAIMTITLALGVRRMAARNAIIRRLPAVDTLGALTVICSDKTGTLTRGEMTVRSIVTSKERFSVEGVGYEPRGSIRAVNGDQARGSTVLEESAPGAPRPEVLPEVLREVLRAGLLCNDSELRREDTSDGEGWTVRGDPMEGALIAASMKAGMDPDEEKRAWRTMDAIPFESKNRFMATLHRSPEGRDGDARDERARDGRARDERALVAYVKGAPEKLIEMCELERSGSGTSPLDRERWQDRAEAMAASGERVLAIATWRREAPGDPDESDRPGGPEGTGGANDPEGTRGANGADDRLRPSRNEQLDVETLGNGLVMLGLFGIIDPPRDAAAGAIAEATRAGIRVKMVTGDHALTARAIADELGIGRDRENGRTATGREIAELEADALARLARESDVFARVDPEHKLRLVQAIQSQNQVVAMTGDGVNDAPALKRADVGIAMGIKGTEAAREASEMVLTDDNFASIIHAVKEGRTVYDNLRKAILFILPTNGGEALTILLAIVLGRALPLTPVQLLWVNMITAVTLGLALAFEPSEKGVMQRPPRSPHQKLLDGFFLWRIAFVSVIMATGTFGLFVWMRENGTSVDVSRTVAVNTLVMFQVFYLLAARHIRESTLSLEGIFGSKHVLGAIATVMFFQLIFTYLPWMQMLFGTAPIESGHWATIVGVGFSVLVLVELEKWFLRRVDR